MSDCIVWLITVEILGAAVLPLSFSIFHALPDRGYSFTKILGLVLVTYFTWIVGSAVPVAGTWMVPAGVVLVLGAASWIWLRKGLVQELSTRARLLLVEEILFLAAAVTYCLLRAYLFGPAISHTEQPMDMMLLNSSLRSDSYPPVDGWMSGHGINYYYFGYLMFATVIKLSRVAPAVGYNLALSLIFATVVCGAFGIAYNLTRRWAWAGLAPLLVALVGNWHAILWLVPHSGCIGSPAPGFWSWMFASTRVVGNAHTLADWSCARAVAGGGSTTINEFPLFSFVLGDLHPHLMALPVALLALGIGFSLLLEECSYRLRGGVGFWVRFLVLAISIGSLFTINSWDFPTYFLVVAACIGVQAYIIDTSSTWWRTPLTFIAVLGACSLVAYTPFYLHFRSLAHGLGWVIDRTDLFEFLQVFGPLLLVATALLATLHLLLRPAEDESEENIPSEPRPDPEVISGWKGERGSTSNAMLLGSLAVVILAVVMHRWVLLGLLVLGGWSLVLLGRVLNTESPNRADAFALILLATASLVLSLTELIYLRDAFDGSADYRMNTVFKFYYQAWLLLGVGGVYGVYRSWHILRTHFGRMPSHILLIIIAIGIGGAALFTTEMSSYADADLKPASHGSLDGVAWMRLDHPGDNAAISWLQAHVSGRPVELESSSTLDYDVMNGRIATFTGLPTVMGWKGHEDQWRPGDSETATRQSDVRTIYQTPVIQIAERLLRKYSVRYVVVGSQEESPLTYPHTRLDLAKFGRFMRVAFEAGGTTIYEW